MNINITHFTRTQQRPQAVAHVRGSDAHPELDGMIRFYQMQNGVLVAAEINGLPKAAGVCSRPIFAMHIHSGDSCSGNESDPFANAMTHYNPMGCPHPYHAGDMPPLFGCNGTAFTAFLTDRFRIREVLGRTVIVHASLDDFTTQPSGNAGAKIGCGVIKPFR